MSDETMPEATRTVLCAGEALIDVVLRPGEQPSEHVGGSLLNVACGVATLGHPALLASWWGRDERGGRIERHVRDRGARIAAGCDGADHTSVAYARLDAQARASYEFDLSWQLPELDDLGDVGHVHTGSIAATLEPGGTQVLDLVRRARDRATVSYDPNIRPTLMLSPDAVAGRIEELVSLSDVVKVSDEDLEWLYPGEPVEGIMRRWSESGPALVVVTLGGSGAYALLVGGKDVFAVAPLDVELADTVGAGDSFMAGLISGLLDAGYIGGPAARERLRSASDAELRPALRRAVATSGVTVTHEGAYAPTRSEVAEALGAEGGGVEPV